MMATYHHLEEEEDDDWEKVAEVTAIEIPCIRVISDDVENMVIVETIGQSRDPGEGDEDSDEEQGIKGVADVDYLPENDNEVSMVRG